MADKRVKRPVDPEVAMARRESFYKAVASGELSVGEAVAAMRKISRLTQTEFAAHRGISVQALRQIENNRGNPTVETLDKIASIFGLQVGFVPKRQGQDAASGPPAATTASP
ncbi:MAG: helix-turn-helix transcriptional regulator [Pseudomonadota bacterium]